MVYEPRSYRKTAAPEGLVCFEVVHKETDLLICAAKDLSPQAHAAILSARDEIETYIASHPRFAESYSPVDVDTGAPAIVADMARAGYAAGVGPMAAVAGAIAEYVARALAEYSDEVIVENGGDVFVIGRVERTLALWAGEEGVRGVGLVVAPEMMPMAVCTSSGRIGHSTSFGAADAVTVLATDASLADAVATALANRIRQPEDVDLALQSAQAIKGVSGVVATVDGRIGAWGAVKLAPIAG
ncbi:MAG: UPF0280 family protein [Coriobacteriia bacterium]|nr:UPF0280 family protein [Coriobacteriia bacterium]